MKKFFKEFKEFITRGNVLDMAVGIIIGGAFTAIITAIVSNVLTPLLNAIGAGNTGDGLGVLQVKLSEAKVGTDGVILREAIVIDFGAVISAIVTFLITAFVLFVIVKAINSVRNGGAKLSEQQAVFKKPEYKALRKEMKAQGKSKAEIDREILAREQASAEAAAAEAAAKEEAEKAEALANAPETLLKEIRDLLAQSVGKSEK